MALNLVQQANLLQSALNGVYTSQGSNSQTGLGDLIAAIVNQPAASSVLGIPILSGAAILATISPVQGQIYLDSDTGTVVFWNGANWIELL